MRLRAAWTSDGGASASGGVHSSRDVVPLGETDSPHDVIAWQQTTAEESHGF